MSNALRLLACQSLPSFKNLCVLKPKLRVISRTSVQGRSLTWTSSRAYASKTTKSRGGQAQKQNRKDERDAREEDTRDRSMKGKSLSTSSLVPGSQQPLSGEDLKEYNAADTKMQQAVDWFRKECATYEGRGVGRVTPGLLQPVRVEVPGGGKDSVPLTDVAIVGVREGTTLVVTAMQDSHLAAIEKAIYAAKIPHIVPQKEDARTIKIPVPRPTVEARNEFVKAATKQAEGTRIQLRRQEQTSIKKRKCEKGSLELNQFHDLLLRHLKEVDDILETLRKRLVGK